MVNIDQNHTQNIEHFYTIVLCGVTAVTAWVLC